MLKLIKNATIYAPESLGRKDILIAGDKIAYINHSISLGSIPCEIIEADGAIITPGFIDQHIHLIGGGGQTGYASLVPEVTVSELVSIGTTTVVGLLGTDGYVKELSTLYAKTKALDEEGLSAYMLTGFYGLPTKTLTDSVAEDLIFIDKVIGCKLAMSDDRSSFPTEQEILRLINQVRLGGFTSGKGGVLHIHLGALSEGITQLLNISKRIPSLTQYLSPTHLIRTEELFRQSVKFAKMGGMIDYSTGGTKFTEPHIAVKLALEAGVPINRITFSSDGHGGVKRTDPNTGITTYTPAPMHRNLQETILLVKECGIPMEEAIKLITTNPAQNLKLKNKGRIAVGYDADICFLNKNLELTGVIAKGNIMMRNKQIVKKGRYEQ